MQFGEQLIADARFPWSVRQQRRIEKRDERFRHFLDAPIRGSAQNGTQDGSWLDRRIGTGLRSTDRLIDLFDELSGKRDSDGNSIGIIHASDGSVHNPAEMKREPIRRLRGAHAVADRLEVVTQRKKL